MSILPEEAQKLTDLRCKMLANIRAGKPKHEGLAAEEIKEALGFLRRNRTAAMANAEKKTKKAAGKVKSTVEVDTKAFTELDLD
jgi:hypothetical protein